MPRYLDIDRLFADRPEKAHLCHSCEGTGRINESYCLSPTDRVNGAVPEGAILAVIVVSSATIFEVAIEASDLARRSHRAVAFDFIDGVVVVHPDQDPNYMAFKWWLARGGSRVVDRAFGRPAAVRLLAPLGKTSSGS